MKRHESRNISRRRTQIRALSPCTRYCYSMGQNAFDYLFQTLAMQKRIAGQTKQEAEKQAAHELKMKTEQKSAAARKERKRNKV